MPASVSVPPTEQQISELIDRRVVTAAPSRSATKHNRRVLFVDDEQTLLDGLRRRLGSEFEVSTANSGQSGLEMIAKHGPFAAIVSDMRMPQMDGLQFIEAARKLAPDSVYLMLTGNQDQSTVTEALNRVQIYRFLAKPCSGPELRDALSESIQHYAVTISEKELLHKTICGAVGMLLDVLQLSQPNLIETSSRIEGRVASLVDCLEIADQWEFKLAAKLSMIGLIYTQRSSRGFRPVQNKKDGNELELIEAARVGQQLIGRIPRLENVASMVGRQFSVDGSLPSLELADEFQVVAMGTTLLRVAQLWDTLVSPLDDGPQTVRAFKRVLPRLAPQLATAIEKMVKRSQEGVLKLTRVADLKEGMVLGGAVTTDQGLVLLNQGSQLTWSTIEKLRTFNVHGKIPDQIPISVVG